LILYKLLLIRIFTRVTNLWSADAFWSVCAMPIGLFLCSWPIIAAWVIAARKASATQKAPIDRKDLR
jgi:hypothetical protein